jgi:hypothetical protein
MKRKNQFLIALLLVLLSCCFVFVGCKKEQGETKALVLETVTETLVVMKIVEADENATALSALTKLKEDGEISFVYTESTYGAYITAINGKEEQSLGTSGYSWMLYTSDTEFSSTEFGSVEYNGKTYGQASKGASELLVKEGELYIWSYEAWSY